MPSDVVPPVILAVLFLLIVLALPAVSQTRRNEVRGIGGATRVFLDEPFFPMAGGALLLSPRERILFGPEALYSEGASFREWSFHGRAVVYLAPSANRAVPYLTGAFGLLRCYDKRIHYTAKEASAGGGFGVKLAIGRRIFLAPEVRLGTHAFPLLSVQLGYSF